MLTYAVPSVVLFTAVGTSTYTMPADVTSIQVLVVGGGGGAGWDGAGEKRVLIHTRTQTHTLFSLFFSSRLYASIIFRHAGNIVMVQAGVEEEASFT